MVAIGLKKMAHLTLNRVLYELSSRAKICLGVCLYRYDHPNDDENLLTAGSASRHPDSSVSELRLAHLQLALADQALKVSKLSGLSILTKIAIFGPSESTYNLCGLV